MLNENQNLQLQIDELKRRLDNFNAGPTIPLAVDLAWQSRGFVKETFFVAGNGTIASNGTYEITIPGSTKNSIALTSSSVTGYMIPALGSTNFGASNTQFDITNPSGDTFRYTYDGTGTDPNINSTTMPIGSRVTIFSSNFNAANQNAASRPYFTITNSGTNFFEISNTTPGVAENNVTIGTGGITGGPSRAYAFFAEGTATTEFSFVVFLFNSLFIDE